MTTTATTPDFYSTRTLAVRFSVSRMTVYRWRLSGFLPPPCFSEGHSTIWSRESIDEWVAAGSPWSDRALAKQAAEAHGGAAGLRAFVKPDFKPSGPAESDKVAALLDDFERRLNECRGLLAQSEASFRQAVGRVTSLRREVAILQNEERENDS